MGFEDYKVKFTVRDQDIGEEIDRLIAELFRNNPCNLLELVMLVFKLRFLPAKKTDPH